jgi:hypothetical protein
MKHKLNYDEAIERLNDERHVSADEVLAHAKERVVWVAEWHLPGCMSESWVCVRRKLDAIEAALGMAAGEAGPPRGMLDDLRHTGRSRKTAPDAMFKGAITTITRTTLGDLL